MSDDGRTVIDPTSGEVVSSEAEEYVIALFTPKELIEYEPLGPGELEMLIRVLCDRLEIAPSILVRLYEARHRSEEEFQKEFSKHVVNSPNKQISFAREYAKFHTIDELHEVNLAKEKLRYAEWLQAALTSKLYGYLNLNKAMSSAASAYHVGR